MVGSPEILDMRAFKMMFNNAFSETVLTEILQSCRGKWRLNLLGIRVELTCFAVVTRIGISSPSDSYDR